MDKQMSYNQETVGNEYELSKEILEKLNKCGVTVGFETIIDKNSAFQAKSNRTKINKDELGDIMKGDHIAFHRPRIIWHHIIVVDVDEKNNRLEVIHYKKMGYCFQIVQEWINVEDQEGDLYRFIYNRNVLMRNPQNVVLERAKNLLHTKEYSLLDHNCEHFASHCKTGDSYSYQVRWMNRKFRESLWTSLSLTFCDVVTDMIGFEFGYAYLICAFILEAFHCAYDIHRQNKARESDRMTGRNFKVSVTQRAIEAVCAALFAILGYVVFANKVAQNIVLWTLGHALSYTPPWILVTAECSPHWLHGIVLSMTKLFWSIAPPLRWVAGVIISGIAGAAGAFMGKAFGSMVGGSLGEWLW